MSRQTEHTYPTRDWTIPLIFPILMLTGMVGTLLLKEQQCSQKPKPTIERCIGDVNRDGLDDRLKIEGEKATVLIQNQNGTYTPLEDYLEKRKSNY